MCPCYDVTIRKINEIVGFKFLKKNSFPTRKKRMKRKKLKNFKKILRDTKLKIKKIRGNIDNRYYVDYKL